MGKSKQDSDQGAEAEDRVTQDYAVTNHAVGPRGFTIGPDNSQQVLVHKGETVKVSLTDAELERLLKHPDLRVGDVEQDEDGSLKPVVSKG